MTTLSNGGTGIHRDEVFGEVGYDALVMTWTQFNALAITIDQQQIQSPLLSTAWTMHVHQAVMH